MDAKVWMRNEDTKQAVLEFEARTGFKVLKARNRNKGSMRPYIFFKIEGKDAFEKAKTYKMGDLKITFYDRVFGKTWEETDFNKAGIDIAKSEFKNVQWGAEAIA